MLWEIAEKAIMTRPVDLIILLGGVCDMTRKFTVGNRRFFWPLEEFEHTFADISSTMKDIARNYRLMAPPCKFVFLPDPGVDLIRLNRIPHPVPWRELIVQEELEEHLETLHLYTRALNSYMGSLTPWSLDVTHAHRHGNLRPVYDRLQDGLHFSGEQVSKLASEINRYARETLVCNTTTLYSNVLEPLEPLEPLVLRTLVIECSKINLIIITTTYQIYLIIISQYVLLSPRRVTSSVRQGIPEEWNRDPERPTIPNDATSLIISSDYQLIDEQFDNINKIVSSDYPAKIIWGHAKLVRLNSLRNKSNRLLHRMYIAVLICELYFLLPAELKFRTCIRICVVSWPSLIT